jgi:hypothetical protein
VDDPIALEADAFVAFLERTERKRFELLRIATQDGVAVAFYRRTDRSVTDEPDLLAVVLDEEVPDQWEAIVGADLRAGGSRQISSRPSKRGDWIVAIYGSAPAHARFATVDHGGMEHRVGVQDGVYALMTRAASEPELALTKPRFE